MSEICSSGHESILTVECNRQRRISSHRLQRPKAAMAVEMQAAEAQSCQAGATRLAGAHGAQLLDGAKSPPRDANM